MFKFSDYNAAELRNLRFFVPTQPMEVIPGLGIGLKSGSRWDGIPVECKFTERRRSLEGDWESWPYKVEVEPVDPSLLTTLGREEYYGCDFESLVNEDRIGLKKKDSEHVEVVEYEEPLCGNTKIRHIGYAVVE